MWLFLIGNGAEIRPLEMGRKGPDLLALSYDVLSGSDITSCVKIDKPLVVYRFYNFMQLPF